jgi:hypothetical protein
MGNVPAFLLVHRSTVEAYQAWNDYGPARTVACFVAETLASAGPTGTERVNQLTVYYPLSVTCPAGSKITLSDGRKGYAAAVARYDTLGLLPTPDHLEVAFSTAGSYGPAFGELVVIVRRVERRDPAGATRYSVTEISVPGAAVRYIGSQELPVGSAPITTDTVEVVLPPDTQVSARDQLRVRGLLYDVDGTPEIVSDSQTTAQPGVKVIGKRRQQT